jgi:hypothetical protein
MDENRDDSATTYYVDVDGTLLCGSINTWFMTERSRGQLSFDDLIEMYTQKMLAISHMGQNEQLLLRLESLKRTQRARLILWTNRGNDLREVTKSQLGEWWYMFDDHLFREGKKISDTLDGIVLDDEERHAKCGKSGFELVRWHCCDDSSCCHKYN